MKKYIIIATAVVLVLVIGTFAFFAFDNYSVYKKAYDKTVALSSAKFEFQMDISTDAGSKKNTVKTVGDGKQKQENGKKVFILDTNDLGQNQKSTIFSNGDTSFMTMDLPSMGEIILDTQLSKEEMQAQSKQFETVFFTRGMVKNIKITKEEKGKRIIAVLNGIKFGTSLRDMMCEQLKSNINIGKADKVQYTFSDIDIDILADKNDYIAEQTMKFKVDVLIPKEASSTGNLSQTSFDMKIFVKLIEPGTPVEIILPDTSNALTYSQLADVLEKQKQ